MCEKANDLCNPAGVEEIKNNLLNELDCAIAWYGKKAGQRGRFARWTRRGMIILGGVSALIPVLTQIPSPIDVVISPLYASVTMIFIATLFAFEKYGGNAEAWMRFVLAKQDLEKLKNELLISWCKFSPANNSSNDVKSALDELLRIANEKHRIVQSETKDWIKEFKSGMASTTPRTN
ncbi:SLATT domain-containing protein [Deefgea piscis]|uniref:SLATT domain-containing protein n=1 Tax=Deefgea piscis TaxID=2739061 RepID=A0A6M8T1U4_9NEIS|nr:SLATT domain-containing protein [Deefgea piscis]QKJ67947.1 SLATT domain-containing protein [Deefgea piscis]